MPVTSLPVSSSSREVPRQPDALASGHPDSKPMWAPASAAANTAAS